ncbi:MAG: MFS transporter [Magnetospirillum sp. WYHS-4]
MMGARPSGLVAWAFYDWANSAFPTVIATFVFAAYFTQAVATDSIAGTAQWGYAMSASGLAVALLAPLLGAVADHGGRRKPWLAVFTLLCVGMTALLWLTRPDPADVLWALVLVGLANVAFEMGMVFYNAMLPDLAPPERIGRWSGWGWGLGYGGGLACLALALVGLVQAETPWFGLDKAQAEPVRATALLAALWFGLFSLPLFLLTPDRAGTGLSVAEATRRGISSLAATLKRAREYRTALRFLLAHMIYTDGLNTLFAFGGVYAAGTFGMDFQELILFGIALNVTAGIGAALFAFADDRFGPKVVIVVSVAALILLGGALLAVESKALFWAFGLPLGIFVGPAQAASRSLMARLAPAEIRAEMFGLYAFSGKATAFLGPALLGMVTTAFASQRAGMATILVFFAVGLLLLLPVRTMRIGLGGDAS